MSTLLAAYAISIRLDPKEFGENAEKMYAPLPLPLPLPQPLPLPLAVTRCERHISLGMPPGTSQFHRISP